jgi:hypothetical protein
VSESGLLASNGYGQHSQVGVESTLAGRLLINIHGISHAGNGGVTSGHVVGH